ncbi:hypothetical protein TESG_03049 [Trichophyton tonsurans CBS 112818]|uniref:Uncharacterized protein n=1 Tax=Trichophyton tonsurans (strain CBS 112818) TaxID=647933 RepID=F2RWA0_TRIT1|nr:hypothetical protein TESG_03049 [Trichophyton tonsurans CBS 112818]
MSGRIFQKVKIEFTPSQTGLITQTLEKLKLLNLSIPEESYDPKAVRKNFLINEIKNAEKNSVINDRQAALSNRWGEQGKGTMESGTSCERNQYLDKDYAVWVIFGGAALVTNIPTMKHAREGTLYFRQVINGSLLRPVKIIVD